MSHARAVCNHGGRHIVTMKWKWLLVTAVTASWPCGTSTAHTVFSCHDHVVRFALPVSGKQAAEGGGVLLHVHGLPPRPEVDRVLLHVWHRHPCSSSKDTDLAYNACVAKVLFCLHMGWI